jgi:hypothetical protein
VQVHPGRAAADASAIWNLAVFHFLGSLGVTDADRPGLRAATAMHARVIDAGDTLRAGHDEVRCRTQMRS